MKKYSRVLAVGALAATASLPLLAGVAHADDPCYTNCAVKVAPQDISRAPAVAPISVVNQPTPAPAPAPTESSLPFTGTDVIELTLIGAGAVAAGTVLVRRSRRATS
jgi:hypothetical protein